MRTLKTQHLKKCFKNRTVVKDVTIQVTSQSIVGLLGPNGAGKTTSFNIIVGFNKPNSGTVILDDKDITSLPIHQRAQLGIGYLPQDRSIFRKLTVKNNILAILERNKKLNKQQQKNHLEQLMQEFHITHLADTQAISLSGGEARRVEIARTLATDPDFILLDEPFAGIDPISIIDIKRMIMQLKKKGIGILITDHNVRETLDICERAYIINEGQVIAEGSTDDILNNQQVKDVYLGNEFDL